MEWIQFVIFSLGIVGLWFWARTESRADFRYMDSKLDAYKNSTETLLAAIHYEMKDFHARLCVIEERNRK